MEFRSRRPYHLRYVMAHQNLAGYLRYPADFARPRRKVAAAVVDNIRTLKPLKHVHYNALRYTPTGNGGTSFRPTVATLYSSCLGTYEY